MARLLSRLRFGRTLVTFALAAVMVTCSFWQHKRYIWKSELVQTYKANSTAPAPEFPAIKFPLGEHPGPRDDHGLRFKKVSLRGSFDYQQQIIVTNRRDISGPGHYLIAPFHIEGTDRRVLVSRGFIPFSERDAEGWKKWDFPDLHEIQGVVQECLTSGTLAPSNPDPKPNAPERIWFFEECSKIARQLPYPILTDVFVQQLGGPPVGEFPKEAVSIQVPPSTHFGYMIEWALLAVLTLVLGIGLQLMPLRPLGRRSK